MTDSSLVSLRRHAEARAAERDWPAAISSFEAILAKRPDDADVLVQLSYMESLSGHYRRARSYALRASLQAPGDARVVTELVARLRTFNEIAAVNRVLDLLPHMSRLEIPLLVSLGAQLSYLNQQEHALSFLDEARRGDPDYPPTLLARAQVLTYLGRFKEAEVDLLRCLQRAPQIPKLYWLLSRLRTQTPSDNHVERIRQLLAKPGLKSEEVALLGYALHKSLDDLGDFEGAWQGLELAGKAKRSSLDYRLEDSRALMQSLIHMPVCAAANLPADMAGRVPIFIVGMHRSGTTLLEQMVDGHSDVHGVGEVYDFTCQMREATDYHCKGVIDRTLVERSHGVDFAAVGRGYLAGMEWRLGKERYFTDKLPSNFLNIGYICQALPHAKILHMVRDPVETCYSNLCELFGEANAYSYDQVELADYHLQYQRLMAHWHQRYPGRIFDVDYRTLTRDPEVVIRQVAAFCEFGYEPRMLDTISRSRGVATASAVQVRAKVVARDVPKWEPYRTHLQPLISHLQS